MLTLPVDFYRTITRLLDAGVIAWVGIVEASPGSAFYVTSHPTDIWHDGRTFQSWPMSVGIQVRDGNADLTTVDLTLSNLGRLPMRYLEAGGWDQGLVLLRLVLVQDPDGQPTGIEFLYAMQSAAATRKEVTIALGQPNFFLKRFPARIYLRDLFAPGIPRNVA